MKRIFLCSILVSFSLFSKAQLSFFNIPNSDMLPDVGYAYAVYERYQSLKGTEAVNASVFRFPTQETSFLEVVATALLNSDNSEDSNRIALATKWKPNLLKKGIFPSPCLPATGRVSAMMKRL